MPYELSCCSFVFFLHFKCEVEAVGVFEGGIVVADEAAIFEKSKVSESKNFGLPFFLLWDFDVLAQMHGKEEGKNGELQDCTLQLCQLLLGNFSDFGNDKGGDGFLLFFL